MSFAGLRVAIVHDWLQGMHGSERTVEAMITGVFADAECCDLYTFHAAHDVLSEELSRAVVRDAAITRLPGLRQRGHDPGRWRWLLPYMPRWFERLELDYDIVVSSSHAFAVAAHPSRAGALHLCYCYTPARYVWRRDVDGRRVDGLKGMVMSRLVGRLRRGDLAAAARVDGYVAISTAVAGRITDAYGRDAPVIFPPVDTDHFAPAATRDRDHFTWVHRLTPYKRPEEVAQAFRGLPDLRLTMVGVGPLEAQLRAQLPPNIELRGWIDRAELTDLLSSSGGFIHVGEEDFGISMVEALASGAPVVALDHGGAADIVRDGENGVVISEATPEAIREAVLETREREWDPAALVCSAQAFSRDTFVERLGAHIAELRG